MQLEIESEWTAAGAARGHARLLLTRWLAGQAPSAQAARRHAPFPATLIARLPEISARLEQTARIASRHPSSDGSTRLLVRMLDGKTVECVLLLRDGVCLSTQIGCAVGCRFCKTGEGGLLRQLSADEILAQFALAQQERRALDQAPLRRVVLMGMGEPAHNLTAVLRAISELGGAGRLGHKQIVFSTVGDPRAIEALARHDVKPALALSLHSMDDVLRTSLLPRAPRIPVRELLDLALGYARATGHPLQVQWTLLAGVNDGDGEIAELARAIGNARAIVNVIPWNSVDGSKFECPPMSRSVEFVRALKLRGVFATIRRSAGVDVDGACGQLRSRLDPQVVAGAKS